MRFIESFMKENEIQTYYHGRYGSQQLRTDTVIQWSDSLDTAKRYAGKNGSIWKLEDTSDFIDAKDAIELVKKELDSESMPDWLDDFAIEAYESNPEKFLAEINPKNIVDSAGRWDDSSFVDWFIDTFDMHDKGVILYDGVVTFSPKAGNPVKIESEYSESFTSIHPFLTEESVNLEEDFKTAEKKFLSQDVSKEEITKYFDIFKKIKDSKIKDFDEKNIDKWASGDWNKFKSFVDSKEKETTKTQEKKLSKMEGAELITENDDWLVYKITDHKACMLYGSGTKWCITAPGGAMWDAYSKNSNFYFLISKTLLQENKWSKIAVQVKNTGITYWDNTDTDHTSLPADLNIPKFDAKEPGILVNGELFSLNDFMKSDIEEINGDLNLAYDLVNSLPKKLKKISGSLYIYDTKISELPAGLEIEGSADISNTPIKSLPAGLSIKNNLHLADTNIKELPKDLKVGAIDGFAGDKSKYPQFHFMESFVSVHPLLMEVAAVNVAQAASVPPPKPGAVASPEVAQQKRTQMGKRAAKYIGQFNQLIPNATRELNMGNVGASTMQLFDLVQDIQKQDWYKSLFKVS